VAALLQGKLAGFTGSILSQRGVLLHVDGVRRFVAAAAGRSYDLILLYPHAGGRSTLAETFASTVEAFTAYLARLEPNGLLAVPHPLSLPPRDSLKLVLTALEALKRLGAAEPARHLVLVRSWDSVLLLVRRTPFEAQELATVDTFAEALAFDIAWRPGMVREAANRFNVLGEPVFFDGVAALTGPNRSAFVASYAFDIRPATDDRPYFLDFFRWRALPMLWATARQGNAGLLDWGWPLQLATLGVAVLSAVVLILLPARLLAKRASRPLRRATATYFLLIGLGFLLVEIAVLQRLVLLLGHPVHAFAVTLAAFLVCAGIGSGITTRAEPVQSHSGGPWFVRLDLVALLIASLASLHAMAGPWLLARGLELPAVARVALAGGLVAPLAIAMGMPFPMALARLRATAPALVPWAWGVNGCASVIAAALAGLLAMSFGVRSLLLAGALAYALAAWVQRGIPDGGLRWGVGASEGGVAAGGQDHIGDTRRRSPGGHP
jgi:hypothetical protein